ncbi:hypothetical protein LRS13_11205 [Svornostia abyssi]|uniref:Uncharacterized protein n=1 Tax=Svornostia abyssi TaxID=2898438 RepID=A0ABY5PN76_9ACTN|nr:hypothetical protein LRS13_11205 [Parviterribacteraceae bacterium J379]
MEVLLVLGLIWLVLATGVVGLCTAAQQADRQSAVRAVPRGGDRRRLRRRARLPVRRPAACPEAVSWRLPVDRRS